MTSAVHKYTLEPGGNKLQLPKNATPLSCGVQYDEGAKIRIWILVDQNENAEEEEREYFVAATGQPFDAANHIFLATVQASTMIGPLVWHVFEVLRSG